MKAPAYQHFASDFLMNAVLMPMEVRGIWITLRSVYWAHGSLPSDLSALARICYANADAFALHWHQHLHKHFVVDGDVLKILDLDEQRAFQERKRAKASESASYRWQNANASTDSVQSDMRSDMRSHKRSQCTSTSTSNKEKQEKESASYDADAVSVFEEWKRVHNHPSARLDSKRANRIKARMKEGFTPDELKRAISGVLRSPWHMGTDPRSDGKRYDGIETIFRDRAQVEKFLELADAKPTPDPSKPETLPFRGTLKPGQTVEEIRELFRASEREMEDSARRAAANWKKLEEEKRRERDKHKQPRPNPFAV